MKTSITSLLIIILAAQANGQEEKSLQKGHLASNKGRFDSAEYYYTKASDYYTSQNDAKSFFDANIYRADNLVNWGKYQSAIQVAKIVEEESEKLIGPRNSFVGRAYVIIGNAERKKGNYQSAIDQYWEAELIFMRDESSRHWLAGLYNETGNALRDNGSYSQAIDYFNKAHNQFQRQNDEINATIAGLNIAACQVMQENYDEALKKYGEGEKFFLQKLGDQHPLFGALYNNIGAAVFYQGKDYPLALQYYSKALAIRQKQNGEISLDAARVCFNIGWVYESMKKYTDAETNYLKAENILNQLFKAGHPLLAWVYNRHGYLFSAQKKFKQAVAMYDLAEIQNTRKVRGENFFLDHVRIIETYKFKSATYYTWYKATGNQEYLKAALKFLTDSEALIRKVGKQTQKEADRLEVSKISRGMFEMGAEVSYELHRITKDPRYLEDFFNFSERGKAQVLNEALEQSHALKFAGIPDSLIAREKEFSVISSEYTQKLLSFDPTRQAATDLKAIEDILFYNSASAKLFEQQLESDYPKYYQLKYKGKEASLKQLQEGIPPGAMIISYISTDSVLFASAITPTDIKVTAVPIKPVQLERAITALRSGILFQQKEVFVKSASQLYKLLVRDNVSSAIKNLIIIPDRKLASIPFEALLESATPDVEFEKMNFLIKRFPISYSSSAQVFLNSKTESTKSNKALLAVAPVFEEGKNAGINLRTRSWLTETEKVKNSGRTRGQLFNGSEIAPLPATADEVNSLYNLFDDNKSIAELMLGSFANERKLKSMNLSDFKYIHIATHGFVNEESPELSGLLLAQDTTDQEDNVLYMGEIYNLQLNSELVTLSACETGLGKIMAGEGVVGIARALTYAGARNILVSLWKVNDASTSELMIDFYRTLLSGDNAIAPALQKAKMKMINGGKYADPYYWSPFVLLGK